MQTTKYIEVEMDGKMVEVDIAIEYSVHNNGIGSYEYWGQCCYDKGTDSVIIEDWTWDTKKYSEEKNELIADAISSKVRKGWEEELNENLYELVFEK